MKRLIKRCFEKGAVPIKHSRKDHDGIDIEGGHGLVAGSRSGGVGLRSAYYRLWLATRLARASMRGVWAH